VIITILEKLNGNNMRALAFLYLLCLLSGATFIIIAMIVEKNFKETHPVKLWWRKHVIGIAPDDIDV
jgi:hypothetical protein